MATRGSVVNYNGRRHFASLNRIYLALLLAVLILLKKNHVSGLLKTILKCPELPDVFFSAKIQKLCFY